jgi:hypothetical protein
VISPHDWGEGFIVDFDLPLYARRLVNGLSGETLVDLTANEQASEPERVATQERVAEESRGASWKFAGKLITFAVGLLIAVPLLTLALGIGSVIAANGRRFSVVRPEPRQFRDSDEWSQECLRCH